MRIDPFHKTLLFFFMFFGVSCHFATPKFTIPESYDVTPIEWSFSCVFPDLYKKEVREGVQYWNSVARYNLFVERPCFDDIDEGHQIIVHQINDYYFNEKNQKRPQTWGSSLAVFFPLRGNQIDLYLPWFRGNLDDMRVSIVRHEFGHALGFGHTEDDPSCLMYPYINSPGYNYSFFEKDACPEELEKFREIYGR